MKNLKLIIVFISAMLINLTTFAQSSDTLFLNTTHVMTAMGQIIANSTTNRIVYTQEGSEILEEKATTDMSYPDENGGTHLSRTSDQFTAIDKEMTDYIGTSIEGDSTMTILAEKDGKNLIISGRTSDNQPFAVWDQQNIEKIDFYVFYINLEKQNFTKKTKIKKIYDLYSLTLRDNHMRHLGTETLEIAGQSFDCQMIKFDYDVIKGKMWFTKDPSGNYFLVKEEAESKEYGAFNMDLTDYSTTKPVKKEIGEGGFGF